MDRDQFRVTLLAVLAATAALVTTALPAPGFAADLMSECNIADQDGDTKALLEDSTDWVDSRVGETYDAGAELKTGADSFIEVVFDPHNSFRMKSATRLRVGKIAEAETDPAGRVVRVVELDLIEGEVGVRLGLLPKNRRLRVTTPTAIAGASGTGFWMQFRPAKALAHIKVVESAVTVLSRDKANKFVVVNPFQQVTAAPWKGTGITALGVGVLSERILGAEFIDQFRQKPEEVRFVVEGSGKPPEAETEQHKRRAAARDAAINDARSNMAAVVIPMPVDELTYISDLLRDDPDKAKAVYDIIAEAEVVDTTFAADDSCTVRVEIDLPALSKALGRDLTKTFATVQQIAKQDYLVKFGNRAYLTTKRAAEADGHRRLVERLNGSVIEARRTLGDEAKTNESVRITITGIVRDAVIVQEKYFADGTIHLLMQVQGDEVQAKLGELVGDTYLSSPETVMVTDFEDLPRLAGD